MLPALCRVIVRSNAWTLPDDIRNTTLAEQRVPRASSLKTDVAVIGAGPAGLLLGHLLRLAGIDVVILERQSREHVEGRIRAGILEDATSQILTRLGIGERMLAEGIAHHGFCLGNANQRIRIDVRKHTGRSVMVYGQTELTKDLIEAAPGRGLEIVWHAADVELHDIESEAPHITFVSGDESRRLDARFIVGCDGYHGPSRRSIPDTVGVACELVYPFGWLGILADVPPCHDELIYASHDRGFALASMRTRTRSRYYIQVPIDDAIDDWPDERLWDELEIRLGADVATSIARGPAIEKSIAPLRSYVFAPMQHGSLFLAGDAAHIVPPTGAKGLNLAASDVAYLSEAMITFFNDGSTKGVDGYSNTALARVWKAERFSWQLTKLTHRFPDDGPFERRMQLAELDYLASSDAAQLSIAENYVGLPM